MGVELYYMPESPPCRLVEMVASLVGAPVNKHPLNLFTKEHLGEEYVKLNPRHKVPFIVDGDLKINESRAIATYLVNKYKPNSALYPQDPVVRAKIDELLYFDAGSLYEAGSTLLRPYILTKVSALDRAAESNYRDILGYLDSRIQGNGGKKFILGDDITIADVALATSFSFPAACGYDLSDFKSLTAYLDRVRAAIPKFAEINDGPNENMRKFIKSKQEA